MKILYDKIKTQKYLIECSRKVSFTTTDLEMSQTVLGIKMGYTTTGTGTSNGHFHIGKFSKVLGPEISHSDHVLKSL